VNPKTRPAAPPKPEPVNGWVHKCDLDDWLGRYTPIPTQVVSNEEFYPLPQTPEQKAVEHHIGEMAERQARRLSIDRRSFLRTSAGMATAFLALNKVFGDYFTVRAAEAAEPAAAQEGRVDYFIFDVQTHHVEAGRELPLLIDWRNQARAWNSFLEGPAEPAEIHLENYIKEVFLDSETDVATISGVPSLSDEENILPPDKMARSRNWINLIARSRRMVSHGLFSPDLGSRNLESMHVQAEKLKLEAWKGYTGLGLGADKNGWWVDDEKVAYPALELARKLKVRNICLHKGLALGLFNEEHCHPRDIAKVSKDFPDLNFLIYHSGLRSVEDAARAVRPDAPDGGRLPWVSDLCEMRRQNPRMTNVYMELGSTFGMSVITSPEAACHILGMIIGAFGADHVLWGTDSVWWGSPQWQIEALKRLQMPESLQKRYGYQPLTTEVKRQIFGLNAARLYGVDPQERRNPVPSDYVDRLRDLYKQAGGPMPSNTQYGWVAAG
jgi:uncharacterized protein